MDVIFTSPSRFIRLNMQNGIKTVIDLLESTSQSSIPDESAVDYVLYKLDEITSFCERANIEYPEIVTQEIVDYLKTSQHIIETMQSAGADFVRNTIFVSHKRGRRSFQIPKTSLQILIHYNFSQQHIARMLGVSARIINRRLKEHDIKPKTYSNITEIELDAIVRTYIEMFPNCGNERITKFDSLMEFSSHVYVARRSVWITDALIAVKSYGEKEIYRRRSQCALARQWKS